MQLRKKLIGGLLVSLLALGATACGDDGGGAGETPTEPAGAEATATATAS
jgi:hypothetical protein